MLTERDDVRILVRLAPRAARDEVVGFEGEVLRVRVKAPPVEGKANEALLRLLAKALGVPRSSLNVVRGQASRDKIVAVEGLDSAEVRRRIELRASTLEARARGLPLWPDSETRGGRWPPSA